MPNSQWVLSGLYRWAKFGWNLICYACRILSLENTRWQAIGRLRENMRSLTEPEVHNVSKRRQRRTEPWLQATCTKIEVRPCGFWVMRADKQTNRQTPTDILVTILSGRYRLAKFGLNLAFCACILSPLRNTHDVPCIRGRSSPNEKLHLFDFLICKTLTEITNAVPCNKHVAIERKLWKFQRYRPCVVWVGGC